MDTLIMEDFRCFAGRHEIPLAPLTLLVGENSSGKTSFLAAIRTAWDAVDGRYWGGRLGVNERPFQLGAFEQLVWTPFGAPASQSFLLGVALPPRRSRPEQRILQGMPPPTVRNLTLERRFRDAEGMPEHDVTIVRAERGDNINEKYALIADVDRDHEVLEFQHDNAMWRSTDARSYYALVDATRLGARSAAGRQAVEEVHNAWPELPKDYIPIAQALAAELVRPTSLSGRPYAFAPVRSKPERTYDPLRADLDDEGQRAALRLAQSFARNRKVVADSGLITFGATSGLFDSIDVKLFGAMADPFQINLEIRQSIRNIVDVGYGVSQVLPILVELLIPVSLDQGSRVFRPSDTYLIQQPEVHLHPKAQSALGSLFARIAGKERQLIVETHSDYLIDRVRMDIRDGMGVKSEDVSLLYFEPTKDGTQIHRLRFTASGEVCGVNPSGEDVDPPPGYRAFFLQESLRLYAGLS